jgi:hypothetical protein
MATTDELEQRIAALEARFPKSMAGPIANSLNVAQIGYSPSAASSMFLNMIGNQAGVAPRLSVTDASKVVRAEIGNLAANGSSPAQFGFRASDASGNPIFDSLGLIAVMTSLGQAHIGGGTLTITSTTPTVLTASPVSFNLARTGRILVFSVVSAWITAGGNYGINTLFLDSVDQVFTAGLTNAMYCPEFAGGGTGALTVSSVWCQSVAAGSHTFDIRGAINTGPGTMTIYDFGLYVFGLGS